MRWKLLDIKIPPSLPLKKGEALSFRKGGLGVDFKIRIPDNL